MRKILILSAVALLVTGTVAPVCLNREPNQPTATDNGDNTVTITWTMPSDACDPDNFRVQSSIDGGTTWTTLDTLSGTVFTYTTGFLSPGMYIFQVGASYPLNPGFFTYSPVSDPAIVISSINEVTILRLPATIYTNQDFEIKCAIITSCAISIALAIQGENGSFVFLKTEPLTAPFAGFHTFTQNISLAGTYTYAAILGGCTAASAQVLVTVVEPNTAPFFSCTLFS